MVSVLCFFVGEYYKGQYHYHCMINQYSSNQRITLRGGENVMGTYQNNHKRM